MVTVKNAVKARSTKVAAGQQGVPAPDLQKFLNSFKLPGVDLNSIVESGQADLKAVAQANRRAYQGMQAQTRRQTQMLREAAADWQVAVKALAAVDADELLAQRTALARQVIGKTLANVRELAETSTRSQAEACAAASARLREHLADLKKALPRRPAAPRQRTDSKQPEPQDEGRSCGEGTHHPARVASVPKRIQAPLPRRTKLHRRERRSRARRQLHGFEARTDRRRCRCARWPSSAPA